MGPYYIVVNPNGIATINFQQIYLSFRGGDFLHQLQDLGTGPIVIDGVTWCHQILYAAVLVYVTVLVNILIEPVRYTKTNICINIYICVCLGIFI